MFAYIKGTLASSSITYAIVETGGIGYKIFIPASAPVRLPQIGSDVALHLSFVVREQAQSLYGFLTVQERDFFEALLGVTGIGPKIALALIGHMPLKDLQNAIIQEDSATICRVPGIGKKGAERLIIEMRDKIPSTALSPSELSIHPISDPRSQTIHDAMSALINLGYTQVTAQKAIQKILKEASPNIDAASLVSSALKHL